jgi:hypothetical protein
MSLKQIGGKLKIVLEKIFSHNCKKLKLNGLHAINGYLKFL